MTMLKNSLFLNLIFGFLSSAVNLSSASHLSLYPALTSIAAFLVVVGLGVSPKLWISIFSLVEFLAVHEPVFAAAFIGLVGHGAPSHLSMFCFALWGDPAIYDPFYFTSACPGVYSPSFTHFGMLRFALKAVVAWCFFARPSLVNPCAFGCLPVGRFMSWWCLCCALSPFNPSTRQIWLVLSPSSESGKSYSGISCYTCSFFHSYLVCCHVYMPDTSNASISKLSSESCLFWCFFLVTMRVWDPFYRWLLLFLQFDCHLCLIFAYISLLKSNLFPAHYSDVSFISAMHLVLLVVLFSCSSIICIWYLLGLLLCVCLMQGVGGFLCVCWSIWIPFWMFLLVTSCLCCVSGGALFPPSSGLRLFGFVLSIFPFSNT